MANNQTAGGRLQPGDDEIVIDLWELFLEFKKRILIILLAGVLGGTAGFCISRFLMTPTYTSTSMIYVMSKDTTITSLADLQIGSQLTNDYKVLVTSRTVMDDVIKRLELPFEYRTLRGRITLNNPQSTRILQISALDTDPERAKKIVDEVALAASDYIADIMEQDPPKIIEEGEIPTSRTGPRTGRNTAIGALLAMLLICALITLDVITNDAIRTEDDIEEYFGIPVLAAIPLRSAEEAKKSSEYRSHGRRFLERFRPGSGGGYYAQGESGASSGSGGAKKNAGRSRKGGRG